MFNKHFVLFLSIFIILILIPFSFAVENNESIGLEIDNDNSQILNDFSNSIHVDVNGNDNNDGNEGSPIATINKAINISSNNSKIFLHEGFYRENNLNITKPLEIHGIGNVIIDAENSSRIFTINTKPNDEVILSGITFINGKTYDRKTNSEGIATLPINLMAGTYTIIAEYGENTISSTIIVNKA